MTHEEYKLLIEVFQNKIDGRQKAARAYAYDYVATGDENSLSMAKDNIQREKFWSSALKVVEEFQVDQLRPTVDS